jgi:hypothetical protein
MNSINHGFILESPQPEDFIFGDRKLGDVPINPSGDWSDYLPDVEVQNLNGIEPYACVTFTILNCVETLERQEYCIAANYSDRFLATISDTKKNNGASPQSVAQDLKNMGCVKENDLPFDSTINTFDKFYAPIDKYLYTLALQFIAEFNFGHSYVPSNVSALKESLTYSPLLFSTYAWTKDDNDLYYRPQGESDNHAVMCYGYVEGKYWKVLDSYKDNGTVLKNIRWDSLPQQAKRFTLHRQIISESNWQNFIKLLRQLFGL